MQPGGLPGPPTVDIGQLAEPGQHGADAADLGQGQRCGRLRGGWGWHGRVPLNYWPRALTAPGAASWLLPAGGRPARSLRPSPPPSRLAGAVRWKEWGGLVVPPPPVQGRP